MRPQVAAKRICFGQAIVYAGLFSQPPVSIGSRKTAILYLAARRSIARARAESRNRSGGQINLAGQTDGFRHTCCHPDDPPCSRRRGDLPILRLKPAALRLLRKWFGLA